jgi:hypothetical protein
MREQAVGGINGRNGSGNIKETNGRSNFVLVKEAKEAFLKTNI